MHPAVALRYPFLTLEQAAGFLGVSLAEAQRRYDEGELPRARRADGGPFEPTPGLSLIPYLEFKEKASPESQQLLERWQLGEAEVRCHRSKVVK